MRKLFSLLLHRQWSQRFFVVMRKRRTIAAMDVAAMRGIGSKQAVALDTTSVICL
jgi:hypothetical protein